jgi:hypothetical protein
MALGPSRVGALTASAGVLLGLGAFTAPATATVTAHTSGGAARTSAHRPANLLRGNAATFDHSIGGWSAPNATLHDNHSTTRHGGGALAIQPRLAPNTSPVRAVSPQVASRSGLYTASFWLRGSAVRSKITATLVFLDAARQGLASVTGSSVKPSGSWQQVPSVIALAPAGTRYVQAAVVIHQAKLVSTLYVDDVHLTRVPAPRRPSLRRVSVHGNHLVDGNGHTVVMRGINRPGFEAKPNWVMTPSDVRAMARWGVNVVRLPLSPNFWLKKGCAYDRRYRGRVDTVVRLLSQAHIYAMLDLHTVTPCGENNSYPMPTRSLALPFWREVASRYKNDPLVGFDLWNEPHDVGTPKWLHGGTMKYGTTFRAAGMQTMYDAIRKTGARNIVFVSGLYWSASPASKTVRGRNIVYAEHAYTCPHDPPPNCGYHGRNPYDPSGYLKRWDALAKHHAVMVTEFGWPDRNDSGRYVRNLIDDARHRGRGWAVYGYNSSLNGKFDIVARRLKNDVFEPSPVGMPALRALAARH